MKLKPCPFCGAKPDLRKLQALQNYDDNGNLWPGMRTLPEDIIGCINISGCDVRPRLMRVNTKDAVKIWNERY